MNFRQWFEEANWQTACVVIVRDNKALILRRGATAPWMPGKWNLPGGGLDKGETPEQAAAREAREETGLMVKGLKLISHDHDKDLGDMFFFSGSADGIVNLDYENDQYKWVGLNDLDRYHFVPYVREAVHKVLDFSAKNSIIKI